MALPMAHRMAHRMAHLKALPMVLLTVLLMVLPKAHLRLHLACPCPTTTTNPSTRMVRLVQEALLLLLCIRIHFRLPMRAQVLQALRLATATDLDQAILQGILRPPMMASQPPPMIHQMPPTSTALSGFSNNAPPPLVPPPPAAAAAASGNSVRPLPGSNVQPPPHSGSLQPPPNIVQPPPAAAHGTNSTLTPSPMAPPAYRPKTSYQPVKHDSPRPVHHNQQQQQQQQQGHLPGHGSLQPPGPPGVGIGGGSHSTLQRPPLVPVVSSASFDADDRPTELLPVEDEDDDDARSIYSAPKTPSLSSLTPHAQSPMISPSPSLSPALSYLSVSNTSTIASTLTPPHHPPPSNNGSSRPSAASIFTSPALPTPASQPAPEQARPDHFPGVGGGSYQPKSAYQPKPPMAPPKESPKPAPSSISSSDTIKVEVVDASFHRPPSSIGGLSVDANIKVPLPSEPSTVPRPPVLTSSQQSYLGQATSSLPPAPPKLSTPPIQTSSQQQQQQQPSGRSSHHLFSEGSQESISLDSLEQFVNNINVTSTNANTDDIAPVPPPKTTLEKRYTLTDAPLRDSADSSALPAVAPLGLTPKRPTSQPSPGSVTPVLPRDQLTETLAAAGPPPPLANATKPEVAQASYFAPQPDQVFSFGHGPSSQGAPGVAPGGSIHPVPANRPVTQQQQQHPPSTPFGEKALSFLNPDYMNNQISSMAASQDNSPAQLAPPMVRRNKTLRRAANMTGTGMAPHQPNDGANNAALLPQNPQPPVPPLPVSTPPPFNVTPDELYPYLLRIVLLAQSLEAPPPAAPAPVHVGTDKETHKDLIKAVRTKVKEILSNKDRTPMYQDPVVKQALSNMEPKQFKDSTNVEGLLVTFTIEMTRIQQARGITPANRFDQIAIMTKIVRDAIRHDPFPGHEGILQRLEKQAKPVPAKPHATAQADKLLKVIKDLFRLQDSTRQQRMNDLKRTSTKQNALDDLKKIAVNLGLDAFPYPGKEDYYDQGHHSAFKNRERSAVTGLIRALASSMQSSVGADANSRSEFVFIPVNPKEYYRLLLNMCVDHALISHSETEPVANLLSTATKALLKECGIRWRLTSSWRDILYMEVIKERYREGKLPIGFLLEFMQSKLYKDADIPQWHITEANMLSDFYGSLNYMMFDNINHDIGDLEKVSLSYFSAMLNILDKVHEQEVFQRMNINMSPFIEDIKETVLVEAVKRFQNKDDEIQKEGFENETVPLTKTAVFIVSEHSKLKKRFPQKIFP
ncbi:hypothetical protein DFQ27_000345 [Actinomortierella ambigua]|uniref:Uncharacterized protein n=1 Tax=Actinomortierella ambigua TaxID=1343610 RepID=A0A9P6U9X6_9FUNG|nr:hypothetical protein DFQ27_000345 [Actinomortierella ambigua]